MKPDKVLCCRFSFAFLVLTVQKKHNICLLRTEDIINRNLLVQRNSCIVYECKTKDFAVMDLPT